MAKGMDYRYFEYLAGRIRAGDNDAFTELYEQTYDTMYRYAYYFLQDPDQVLDALQEIYIAIFKNIHTLKVDRLLPSWMRQIAYHICCDMAEEQKRDRERSVALTTDEYDLQDHVVHTEADAYRSVYDKDTQFRLHDALRKCSSKERQAFTLWYKFDLTPAEIADFMDVSVASAKRYIASARATLSKETATISATVKS